jgi:hypothetical protein
LAWLRPQASSDNPGDLGVDRDVAGLEPSYLAVQAFVGRPECGEPDAQVPAWATTGEDTLVAEGTASVGNPAAASALHSRDLRPAEPGELRILSAIKP